MTDSLPAWPRDTLYVHVTPAHVRNGRPGSLTLCAAALAVAEALLPAPVKVTVDVDQAAAHETAPPFRWWHAETPEEVAEWTAELDAGGDISAHEEAARLGLLDFTLTWTEGPSSEQDITRSAARAAGGENRWQAP